MGFLRVTGAISSRRCFWPDRPSRGRGRRITAWLVTAAACIASLALHSAAFAQSNVRLPAETPAAPGSNGLSATKGRILASWQERLTLGPGDILDISLYTHPDTLRPAMAIAPDGRLSYLEARDVVAAGLTIDELRTLLESRLAAFHLTPRVIVNPKAIVSKKYMILGNVVQRGVYPLDRPITIVEAIARAKGFSAAGEQRSAFDLVDFSHALLVRRAADGSFGRESIDFEALFARGELDQNKVLAPDDYLYFPPLAVEDVYTLGEVRAPGVVPFTKDLTAIGAIARRGGFTDAAFRQRVLVVRGSLDHPETFVIDSAKTLRAQARDFALQPRDIVYVSRKPWAKAEELLRVASSDFVRAVAVSWTGREVGIIK